MKLTKKFIKRFTSITAICSAFILGTVAYLENYLPDRYYVDTGNHLTFSQEYLSSDIPDYANYPVSIQNGQQKQSIRLLGIIPIKEVSVEISDPVTLIPSGEQFGVKMFTKGAMVVGLVDIPTAKGVASPGKKAGIKEGDIILSVNKKDISRNEEVALIIESSNGKPLLFKIQRGDEVLDITLTPALSSNDNQYKSGIWVRDSAAGIGTITYLDKTNHSFGGLGHPICDVDTGEILPVGSGEVCDVTIHNINKGKAGTPGELLGVFASDTPIGNIITNNNTGIYGQIFDCNTGQKEYPLARKQEVEIGPATILCSLKDESPKEYQVEIVSVDYNENNKVKNMIVKVVDDKLLELTGGIVQGMSGTPILQNGKLVGAITHVFINDPKKGYGIFAENMYENSKKIKNSDLAA